MSKNYSSVWEVRIEAGRRKVKGMTEADEIITVLKRHKEGSNEISNRNMQ